MGFLSNIIGNNNKPSSRRKPLSLEDATDFMLDKTKNEIKRGLERPNASTGTSMEELYGAAKTIATLSNIGGGSKKTGGGGIGKGMDTLTKYAGAKSVKEAIKATERKRLKK